MLSPTNDTVILVPVDPALMSLVKDERFGLKARDSGPEECLRWKVIAAGPGTLSSAGTPCPNPLNVGDVVILVSSTNSALREKYAKSTQLIDGQKYIICRGFDLNVQLIVERTS